jgi:hypothetical protein
MIIETNKKNKKIVNFDIPDNSVTQNQINQVNNQIKEMTQNDIDNRNKLNTEIIKLREQMQDQQLNLFNQINSLKQETQTANQQRFEALKEIDKLKEELSKQREDEEIRRKYVYDIIADDNSKIGNVFAETHLPENNIEKFSLPIKKEKDIFYEEKIRNPNKIIPIPKLTELDENGMKSDSKFIDLNTHNIISGLEIYKPNINLMTSEDKRLNNKGFEVEGDFGTLRSYYKDSIDLNSKNNLNYDFNESVNKNINENVNDLEEFSLDVNRIYNRNMDRLRNLNDIQDKTNNGAELIQSLNEKSKGLDEINKNLENQENFDDFINKINQTCKTNY